MGTKKRRTTPITLSLAPSLYRLVELHAAKNGVDLLEAVETILRDALMDELEPADKRQVQAESELMEIVGRLVTDISQTGWDEDVTAAVFEKIADEHLDLYREAVGGDPFHFGNAEKSRINKRIGARIKRLLAADIVMSRGIRAKGQPSRKTPSLIMSYTLLRPRNVGKRNRRG